MKIETLWEEVVRRMPFEREGKERGYYEAMEMGFCLGLMLAPGIDVNLRMEALAMLEGIGS